jgi:hypothetical protein
MSAVFVLGDGTVPAGLRFVSRVPATYVAGYGDAALRAGIAQGLDSRGHQGESLLAGAHRQSLLAKAEVDLRNLFANLTNRRVPHLRRLLAKVG